jgi:hypothetical protein
MLLIKCIYDTPYRLMVLKELLNQFCPEILKTTVYNALALLILLYGSEIRTLREEDKERLTSIENKCFRTASYIQFDHKRNEGILEQENQLMRN